MDELVVSGWSSEDRSIVLVGVVGCGGWWLVGGCFARLSVRENYPSIQQTGMGEL